MWRQLALSSAVAAIAVFAILSGRRPARFQPVQYRATQEPAVGRLLIARPQLPDPNFAESVVLILQYDEDKGAMGLIINRRTKVPLSRVFPQVKGAKADLVYEGGPVGTSSAQALLRSTEKPEGAVRVLGDVWATGSKERIEKSVTAGDASATFRLYAGYGGWGPGQLEHEIELGGWSVLRATAALVFDDDPDSLWQRLQHQTETRIARHTSSDRIRTAACFPPSPISPSGPTQAGQPESHAHERIRSLDPASNREFILNNAALWPIPPV